MHCIFSLSLSLFLSLSFRMPLSQGTLFSWLQGAMVIQSVFPMVMSMLVVAIPRLIVSDRHFKIIIIIA